jgi:demethylmenaquinone methyltransferase/2-methoxy-6-polyprenyl-1,4-benzoquinol methylase
MANGKQVLHFSEHEDNRERQFKRIWVNELDDVFADVAKYYDQANHIASLGLRDWLHDSFLSTIQLHSGQKVLDVCAGTNAIGIATLHKQSDLDVHALDRSKAMQEVGQCRARQQGMKIKSFIGDAHSLPFADNYFDVVTLQYASRHLRILDVCQEVHRVLKPDGHFYHSDMLRPANKIVEMGYYLYLRACLTFTALLFRSLVSQWPRRHELPRVLHFRAQDVLLCGRIFTDAAPCWFRCGVEQDGARRHSWFPQSSEGETHGDIESSIRVPIEALWV